MKSYFFRMLLIAAFICSGVQTIKAAGNQIQTMSSVIGGEIENLGVDELINILDKLEGHIYLSAGDQRNLTSMFNATDQLPGDGNAQHYTWTSANPGIASVDAESGVVTANAFGQTFVIAHGNTTDHYVAVFVCPTLTVKSPEGAIYVHQKMYNAVAKVQLTQSPEWVVNCVMMAYLDKNGEWQYKDVTADVTADGQYVSEDPINENRILTVSMGSRERFGDEDNVVGTSGINLQVRSQQNSITITEDDSENDPYITPGTKIDIFNMYGKLVMSDVEISDGGVIEMGDNQGVFTIKVKNEQGEYRRGQFKVILQREYIINQFN